MPDHKVTVVINGAIIVNYCVGVSEEINRSRVVIFQGWLIWRSNADYEYASP